MNHPPPSGTKVKGEHRDLVERAMPHLWAFLRSRYRGISADHENIIQQAAEDLILYLQGKPQVLPLDDVVGVGRAIIQRRVADKFRNESREALLGSSMYQHYVTSELFKAPDTEDVVSTQELLKAVLSIILELREDQQRLLLDEIIPAELKESPRHQVTRKQLSRLREYLKMQLLKKHGIKKGDLLR